MNEIELFPYDGGTFPLIPTDKVQSGYAIAVTPVCNWLGISPNMQAARINSSPWSKGCTMVTIVQLPGDRQSRSHLLLDAKRVSMWLATVRTNRIKNPEARERIERWQVEAADALDDYLRRGVATNDRFSAEHIEAEVQRQLEKRQYKAVVRDTLKSIGTESGWQYGEVRNIVLRAVCGMKAPELLASGRDLQTWANEKPRKADHEVATNYLFADELELFNVITDAVAVDLRFRKPRNYQEFLIVVRDAADRYTA